MHPRNSNLAHDDPPRDPTIAQWFAAVGPPPTGAAPPHLQAKVRARLAQYLAQRGLRAWLSWDGDPESLLRDLEDTLGMVFSHCIVKVQCECLFRGADVCKLVVDSRLVKLDLKCVLDCCEHQHSGISLEKCLKLLKWLEFPF